MELHTKSEREGFCFRTNTWTNLGPLCQHVPVVNIQDTHLRVKDVWKEDDWCLDRFATSLSPAIPGHMQISLNSHVDYRDDQLNGLYTAKAGYHWLLERGQEVEIFKNCWWV